MLLHVYIRIYSPNDITEILAKGSSIDYVSVWSFPKACNLYPRFPAHYCSHELVFLEHEVTGDWYSSNMTNKKETFFYS